MSHPSTDIVRELHGAADRAGLVCTKTGNFRAAMIDAAHLRAAAAEIERLRDIAKVADIHIAVTLETDSRTDSKTGKDLSQLASVEVVSHFRMTPEFLEDLQRIGKQYEELGMRIAETLRTAVKQRGGADIRSIATHRPWRAQ